MELWSNGVMESRKEKKELAFLFSKLMENEEE
jgi:hypothetical protein